MPEIYDPVTDTTVAVILDFQQFGRNVRVDMPFKTAQAIASPDGTAQCSAGERCVLAGGTANTGYCSAA